MAASPKYKVFDSYNTYQASCKEPEAAAALMGFYGAGATIRLSHAKRSVVWHEGHEQKEAGESYDYVTHCIRQRERLRILRHAS